MRSCYYVLIPFRVGNGRVVRVTDEWERIEGVEELFATKTPEEEEEQEE